jgi:hypothetical protein
MFGKIAVLCILIHFLDAFDVVMQCCESVVK